MRYSPAPAHLGTNTGRSHGRGCTWPGVRLGGGVFTVVPKRLLVVGEAVGRQAPDCNGEQSTLTRKVRSAGAGTSMRRKGESPPPPLGDCAFRLNCACPPSTAHAPPSDVNWQAV